MVQKPEIQYIGQFYVYGSEAREAALAQSQRKSRYMLPEIRPRQEQRIYVDPVALCALVVAVMMLAALALGAVQISESWREYDAMEQYLMDLKKQNSQLEHEYREGFDIEEIESAALALGMIPATEAKVIGVKVTVPEPASEPTAWDEIVWFLKGLFAEA